MIAKQSLCESILNSLENPSATNIDSQSILPDVFKLQKALDEMRKNDPQLVTILEMYFWGGFTGEEVSRVLGLNPDHVDSQLKEAAALFTGILERFI